MQWLINIIYELCKTYIDDYFAAHPSGGGFFDRGDPNSQDWDANDLTWDEAWHDLDLSSIVPVDSTAVVLRVAYTSSQLPFYFHFRKKGNVNWPNVSECRNMVSNKIHHRDKIVAVDSDLKIQYKAYHTIPSLFLITVAGWYVGSLSAAGFVNRGDPPSHDFSPGDFIKDDSWHELDLTSIIPADTKAILMRCVILTTSDGPFIRFRTAGNVNTENVSECRTPFANKAYSYDIQVPVANLQKIEYYATAATWSVLFLTIKGWWY